MERGHAELAKLIVGAAATPVGARAVLSGTDRLVLFSAATCESHRLGLAEDLSQACFEAVKPALPVGMTRRSPESIYRFRLDFAQQNLQRIFGHLAFPHVRASGLNQSG